ncbi:MAG: type II secretion system protein N, partial [Gammaproteobacteria bacterium]|nr:type II secretion system protein N [Gammaproteobacteria bacterium]
MKIKYYIITGILALGFFFISSIPAVFVVNTFKDQLPQIKIQGVNGTLWNGTARQITIQSKHIFKDVSWSVCVTHLLMAKACIEFDATYDKTAVSGQISAGMNKNIQAKNIKTEISAQALSQIVTIPMATIDGDISVDLETLSWQPGGIPAATGIIKWEKASVTVAEAAQLGDITITLSESGDNPVNAEISNQGGQLAISGQASVNEKTDYDVNLNFKP